MSKPITFKHSGNTGDIIYALAGIKSLCDKYDWSADIRLRLDQKGTYYDGAKHPLGEFIFTDLMYKLLKPLLVTQPWVNSVKKYAGQKIQIDLDLIRQRDINMPFGHIARWYFYVFPDMACDLSKPWIDVPKDDRWSDTIIVNRTERYQNPHIHYSFLRRYKNVVFVGTIGEYQIMVKQIPHMKFADMKNFYQLAIAINSCKMFIGNQSMCFALAEAMKSPRILEVCSFAPNVIPEGPGPAYDFLSQAAFEYYVEELAGVKTVPEKAGDTFVAEFDLNKGRFQQRADGGWHCRPEDMNIVNNTLVDAPRLANIEKFVKQTEHLEGAIAEVGVYKGGTALLIRKTSIKKMYLFDTFEGMPEVMDGVDLHHKGDFADTSLRHVADLLGFVPEGNDRITDDWDAVEINIRDAYVYIRKGLFPSVTAMPNSYMDYVKRYSFVHIDVDIYQSVKDCLEYFYDRVVPGGIICVDDYNEPNCPGAKMAMDDFMFDKPEGRRLNNNPYMDCQSQRAFIKL